MWSGRRGRVGTPPAGRCGIGSKLTICARRPLKTEPFDLAIEPLAVVPENPRGRGLVALDGLEDPLDVTLLDFFHRHELARIVADDQNVTAPVISDFLGQVVDGDVVVAR